MGKLLSGRHDCVTTSVSLAASLKVIVGVITSAIEFLYYLYFDSIIYYLYDVYDSKQLIVTHIGSISEKYYNGMSNTDHYCDTKKTSSSCAKPKSNQAKTYLFASTEKKQRLMEKEAL